MQIFICFLIFACFHKIIQRKYMIFNIVIPFSEILVFCFDIIKEEQFFLTVLSAFHEKYVFVPEF